MSNSSKNLSVRSLYLVIGVVSMLFAGIIYAWSILKAPFGSEFGWSAPDLALNFTLTMCFFCVGGLIGAQLAKRIGSKISIIGAGILAALGLVFTSTLSGTSVTMLYITYGVMAGLGIGMAYNVIISTISAWFPDKKGFCSGCLMMGFGASALVLGNLASSFMSNETIGWRTTFLILGIALGIVLVVTGLIIKRPGADVVFPAPKASKGNNKEDFEVVDMTPAQMLRRLSFWLCFAVLVCLSAVGSSVISFARDLALETGASASLATTLVGVLSVCNGLGRILTGAIFDIIGRRKTMIAANVLTICAAGITLVSVMFTSLPLCIVGLCLTGLSYGSSPTITASFTSAFYGLKNFPTNMSFMTFNIMIASFVATLSSTLRVSSGGYVVPFILLLALTVVALVLNLSIKRP